jgi:transcriptional regulator with XRE-family HTH domain
VRQGLLARTRERIRGPRGRARADRGLCGADDARGAPGTDEWLAGDGPGLLAWPQTPLFRGGYLPLPRLFPDDGALKIPVVLDPSIEAPVNSPPPAERRDVDVGARLRELRTSRRLKLRYVAEAAGISESFLSQVERQKANISLTTLKSVANVFGLTIAEFFDDSHELPYLLREEERPSLEFAGMGTKFLLTPRPGAWSSAGADRTTAA